MKKVIAMLLAFGLLLTATACGDPNGQAQDDPPAQEPENVPAPAPAVEPETEAEAETEGGSVLVVYYSASGRTEAVAGYIANALGGDTFAITPAEPYTSADLNWTDEESRVSREHDDPSLRDIELTTTAVDNWDSYDTVFIG